jgi:antitoxin VapB
MGKTTRTFKSGNSVAVRFPAGLGVKAGTEVRVREEQGAYIVQPVEADEKPARTIDLTGIYGSNPDLGRIDREGEEYEDIPRDWHLLGLDPG